MKRLLVLAVLAALAAAVATAVGVGSVRAAPIPGATHVSGTWSPPDYLFIGASVDGNLSSGLTGLGCPFVPQDAVTEAETSSLTATYSGWMGPINSDTLTQQVLLRTKLTGSLEDASGNVYTVKGKFTDNSINTDPYGDLRFDGVGSVRFSGPTGTVTGRADFRFVTAAPEYTLAFSSIKSCTIS